MTGPSESAPRDDRQTRERPRILSVSGALAGYIGYYLSNILFLVLTLPLAVLFAPFLRSGSRIFMTIIHHYSRFLTQTYLTALRVCRVAEVAGLEHCNTGGPFICVSNHRGRLDALLLIGVLRNTTVLIKAKHARFPMLAHLVRNCGFVSVDQSSVDSMAAALKKCCALTASGTNLLVFPEGTRSTGARLRPFGGMAFKVAVAENLPIVPVLIHSHVPFMAKELATFFPRKTVEYRIIFLKPESPRAGDTATALCDRTYRRMSAELRALDAGTAWARDDGRETKA
jgi:1-acyl-sn-glycerol-3-phosphate acyltransferase